MAVDEFGNVIPEEEGLLAGSISAAGQEVAKQTGVAYEEAAKPSEADWAEYDVTRAAEDVAVGAPVKAGETYVTDKSTVAGQFTSLLADESQYIRLARERGKEFKAERGLLSTSMAAGAAQTAAIEAALPIAAQDAKTFAQAQQIQQQTEAEQQKFAAEAIISGELAKQNAAIKQTHQDVQNTFQSMMASADAQGKVLLQDMQNQHSTMLTEMENTSRELLQSEQITAAKAETMKGQASAIMQNYQISVENMLTDPDFLEMGAEAVQNGINQMQTLARNSIKFLGASFGENMDAIVNQYLKDLTITI